MLFSVSPDAGVGVHGLWEEEATHDDNRHVVPRTPPRELAASGETDCGESPHWKGRLKIPVSYIIIANDFEKKRN